MRHLRLLGIAAVSLLSVVTAAPEMLPHELGPRDDTHPTRLRFLGPKDEAFIGQGDRFNGGKFFPFGASTSIKPKNEDRHVFETIMNHEEIFSAMLGLRAEYGIGLIHPPHLTVEGRKSMIGMIPCEEGQAKTSGACGSDESYTVLLTANLLGHDRSSSDAIIYFVSDLLYARKHDLGLEYGNVTYSKRDVRRAASVGIVFFPMVNVDGMVWDAERNSCWRRNRNNASTEDDKIWKEQSTGVDLNRNFDIAWDFERILDTRLGGANRLNSDSPRNELYRGDHAMSEQETQNIGWVFAKYQRLSWLMDVRVNGRRIVHPWGIDLNQDKDKEQNWRNEDFDGKRGDVWDKDNVYGEYMDPFDKAVHQNVSYLIRDELYAVAGRNHSAGETAYLGPHTGTFIDWAYSRHLVSSNTEKVFSFAFEFGWPEREARKNPAICGYYPSKNSLNINMQEAAVAFMTLLLEASQRRL